MGEMRGPDPLAGPRLLPVIAFRLALPSMYDSYRGGNDDPSSPWGPLPPERAYLATNEFRLGITPLTYDVFDFGRPLAPSPPPLVRALQGLICGSEPCVPNPDSPVELARG